jgi:hypothetical protein
LLWGIAAHRPGSWLNAITLEALEPGTIRINVGPFQPFAVLDGRSNLIIGGSHIDLAAHLQRVMKKRLPTDDMIETQAVLA